MNTGKFLGAHVVHTALIIFWCGSRFVAFGESLQVTGESLFCYRLQVNHIEKKIFIYGVIISIGYGVVTLQGFLTAFIGEVFQIWTWSES